jgi:hypothetical protein
MRRLTSAIIVMTLLAPNVALTARQRDTLQRTQEYWFTYAEKLPIGSTVRVRTSDGKRHVAVLAVVDREGITLEPKTRIPEPPVRVSFDRLEQLELKQNGSSVAKAVAIGAAVGAGTFLGIVALLAASWD